MNNAEYIRWILRDAAETKGMKFRISSAWLGGRCVWSACELPDNYGKVIRVPMEVETDRKHKTVTGFDNSLFQNKKGITDIILHKNIYKIPERAFEGCKDLERIYIPRHITNIGKDAFIGCNKLSDIYYEGTPKDWENMDLHLYERCVLLSGDCQQGRPVESIIEDSRTITAGAEQLLKATLHFNCR